MKRKLNRTSYMGYKGSIAAKRAAAAKRRRTRGWKVVQGNWRRAPNTRSGGYLGVEKKFYDTSLVTSSLTSTANMSGHEKDPTALNCLNGCAQGDGEQQRDGKQIRMDSIQVRGVVNLNGEDSMTSAKTLPNTVICLVLDTQTNGAQLNSEDVFTNPSNSTTGTTCAMRNLQYSKRFRVLAKKTIVFTGAGEAYDGTNVNLNGMRYPFNFYVKLNNMPVDFTGTAAGVANIMNNSLHIVAFETTSDETANTITYNSRLRFYG